MESGWGEWFCRGGFQGQGPGVAGFAAFEAEGADGVVEEACQVEKLVGDDMGHPVFDLQAALYTENGRGHQNPSIGLEHLGPDDDIGETGLVLHRQEDNARRCAWPLPHDDQPGMADRLAIPDFRQAPGGVHAGCVQLTADQ